MFILPRNKASSDAMSKFDGLALLLGNLSRPSDA
jgi:hypothetical protein